MKIEARKGNATQTGSRGIVLKAILCILLVAGIAMCIAGVNSTAAFEASGYDSANAYAAIRHLGQLAETSCPQRISRRFPASCARCSQRYGRLMRRR